MDMQTRERNHYEEVNVVKTYFSQGGTNCVIYFIAKFLKDEGALHFQFNVNVTTSLYKEQDLGGVMNKKIVLFTNK